MESLDALAQKYDTDKSSSWHGYTAVYETLFEPLRHRPVTLLELGVDTGASIRMWRDYFTFGAILGVDNWLPGAREPYGDIPPDVYIFKCDQAASDLPTRIAHWCPLDIIIDDCSHIVDKTIASFDLLFDCLKPDGLYIIEDIQPYDRPTMEVFIDRASVDYDLYDSTAGRGETLAVIHREGAA